jgi:exodeoxyribonuclease X
VSAVILDTETTGLVEPGLVEAAMLGFDSPGSLSAVAFQFAGRFNPGKPIEFGAMATHHITDEDVAGAPSSATFALPQGCQYIIGHNCDFDWQVIGRPNVKRICTLAFSRKFWPDCDSHQLGAMLLRLEGPRAVARLRDAHSAEADVAICATILAHVLAKLEYPKTWEDVWQACELARIPDLMTFGKHKGTKLKDVPRDYKDWLLRQPDIDPYLAKALRA